MRIVYLDDISLSLKKSALKMLYLDKLLLSEA